MDEDRYRAAEAAYWASVGAEPDEISVTLSSTGTAVRVQTVGDGPPVLFVHGGSTSGASWAPLVARLEGFRCLVLDRPGCGLSEPVGRRFDEIDAFANFAADLLPDVLDSLGIESAPVVSTSFGSFFAVHGVHAHPERFDRLLAVAWLFGAPVEKIPFSMRMAAVPPLAWLMTTIPPSKGMIRSIFRQLGLGDALDAGAITDEGIAWFQSTMRDTDTMRNELRTNPPVINPIKGLNETVLFSDSLLGSIQLPVGLIWGTGDPMGGEATAREFASRIPGAELELLEGFSHAPWLDDVDRVAEPAMAFLRG